MVMEAQASPVEPQSVERQQRPRTCATGRGAGRSGNVLFASRPDPLAHRPDEGPEDGAVAGGRHHRHQGDRRHPGRGGRRGAVDEGGHRVHRMAARQPQAGGGAVDRCLVGARPATATPTGSVRCETASATGASPTRRGPRTRGTRRWPRPTWPRRTCCARRWTRHRWTNGARPNGGSRCVRWLTRSARRTPWRPTRRRCSWRWRPAARA